ncbi:Exocyst complex component 5 [Coemansia javaensis]|uniref:Exocyst complex component 5 n=1 Tax=Coemansia javaensis TaxID=2761396 RepID=A0A9W8HB37_9FUNG|nr:Exocyst complex component 5 [Coemansia javaensis]
MARQSDPSREFGLPEGYFAQDAFLPDEFIEEISRSDLEFAKRNASFEPKPFIRTFERALDRLQAAQTALSAEIAQRERSANASAEDHRRKMARLKQTFATVGSSFEQLETQISEVSSNTIRIGEQLDTVANEKDRAVAIKELVEIYAELNEGNARRLDALMESGPEGMVKVAHTLRRLNTIVVDNEYSAPADSAAKRQIEVYSEGFEKTMLGMFETAYRDGDVHSMSTAARTLDAFNGGVSVVKAYINQHPFFLSSMMDHQARGGAGGPEGAGAEGPAALDGASDINRLPPPPDARLARLYADTRAIMFKDWSIVSKVFPRPIEIMQQLLKRVFEQTIQSYLETLFARAEGESKLAFLRVLASAHLETRRLVEDLQKFDAETITPAVVVLESARRSGGSAQGLLDMAGDAQTAAAQFSRRHSHSAKSPDAGADQAAIDDDPDDPDDEAAARDRLGAARSGVGSAVAISVLIGRSEGAGAGVGLLHGFLERCCDDLFEAYIAGSNYINAEQAHLAAAFRQALVPFVRARSERQGPSRSRALLGMLSSVTGSSNSAGGGGGGGGGGGDGSGPGSGAAPGGTDSAAGLESSITADVTRMLLQAHAEAVARAVELESDAAAGADSVAALTSQLLSALGGDYMFPALDDVQESLQDLRQEPDLRAFDAVRTANMVVRLVQVHFQRAIVPFVGNGNYIYRDIVTEKNRLMSRVEASLNVIVNKLAGACTQWIGGLLGKQRKGDFRPAEDDFTAFEMGTQPCRQCTEFLHRIEQACRRALGPENQERVLGDIGNALHRMLMEHLRRYVVSVAGGLVLAKDVSRYREAVSAFGIPALNAKFAVLQDISNIFLVQPSALKSLLDEGPLSRLDRSTLQAFVQMREDSRSSSLVSKLIGISGSSGGGGVRN